MGCDSSILQAEALTAILTGIKQDHIMCANMLIIAASPWLLLPSHRLLSFSSSCHDIQVDFNKVWDGLFCHMYGRVPLLLSAIGAKLKSLLLAPNEDLSKMQMAHYELKSLVKAERFYFY